MNLRTTRRRPAPPDSTRYRSRYLDELLDFGGQALTCAARAPPQPLIDRWLQGQELAARLRARHARLTTTLAPPEPPMLYPHPEPPHHRNAQTPPQR